MAKKPRFRLVRLGVATRLLELLEQLPLALGEVDRGLDRDLDEHVAARLAAQPGYARPGADLPACVPAGTAMRACLPSIVGTSTWLAERCHHRDRHAARKMLGPSRRNRRCGVTLTKMEIAWLGPP
ncbi:MAG: hypothetical protein U1E17_03350 [Geminicoccaceae bacterium]